MIAPVALCLSLCVLGVPPSRAGGPSLAPRLSLAGPAEGMAPDPGGPLAPPFERRGSFAAGWATATGWTLAGDVLAAGTLLVLVRPGEWALQRWVGSVFSGNANGGELHLVPLLLVVGIGTLAAVAWGALPPMFALAGARRGLGVVPSATTRSLTVLAHLAVTAVAVAVMVRRNPGTGVAILAAGDLAIVPAVAAGLTARDATAPAVHARPEHDPALALAR